MSRHKHACSLDTFCATLTYKQVIPIRAETNMHPLGILSVPPVQFWAMRIDSSWDDSVKGLTVGQKNFGQKTVANLSCSPSPLMLT